MQALLCKRHGPPGDLVLENIPSPRPGRDELLVSIKAAAVNFPDVLMIQDKYQHKPPLPFTPGYEFAGIVKSVGADVTGISAGDAGVAIVRAGGFAEEAVVPANRFWRIPAGMDFTQAAAFPLAYGTSYHALKDRAHIKPGETLLVLGAAGGVGIAAVQLGKLMGARVIACASSDAKLETCRQHGADDVINYLKDDLRKAVKRLTDDRGVDVILDPVGGEHAESAVRSMAWDGRYLVVGFAGGAIPRIPTNLALLKGCAMVGVAWDTYSRRNPAGGENNISELLSLINTGKLKPLISKIYSLTDAALAIDDVMQRRAQGKVIVVPG